MFLNITDNELIILKELAKKIHIEPSENPDLFCQEAKALSMDIPKRVRDHLQEFILNGSETGFFLLKSGPTTNNPPTPPGNSFKVGEKTELAKIQAILIQSIGEMIAYEAEGYGRLFQDVVPIHKMAKEQTSMGSNVELEIHTEQAFSELRPDILSLACIRGDLSANTYILPVNIIMDNISQEDQYLLFEPRWKTGIDLSFKLIGENQTSHEFIHGDIRGPMSILTGPIKNPLLRFDQDLMWGLDEDADKMVKKIIDIYHQHKISHNLKSGEIIFIDNRRAVHGRSPFFPRYDGEDRFLVRCFATLDYDKSEEARYNQDRMVRAIYS